LQEHSGRHNGDDMEATAIAMRKGYEVGYEPLIEIRTIVPQTPKEFYRQRKRWDLGALETYDKERRFYIREIQRMQSRLGHVTVIDWYGWLTAIFFPCFVYTLALNGLQHLGQFLDQFAIYQAVQFVMVGVFAFAARHEVQRKWELILTPIMPFYLMIEIVPRLAAFGQFLRDKMGQVRFQLKLTISIPRLEIVSANFNTISKLRESSHFSTDTHELFGKKLELEVAAR